jgi:predicted component of type VI protein secretion system
MSVEILLTWTDPRSGELQEQNFPLPITVGRDSSNHLVLPSSSVSRQHAQILPQADKIKVKDLNSSNGTFINGEAIEEAEAKEGDEITFGEVKVKLSLPTAEMREKRPSRDRLYSALLAGEQEKTISLKSIRGKNALFGDIPADSGAVIESPVPAPADPPPGTGEKLSGDALKSFLSKRLQKDIAEDISPDVEKMADDLVPQRKDEPAPTPPPAPSQPAAQLPPAPPPPSSDKPEGFLGKIRRLFGG